MRSSWLGTAGIALVCVPCILVLVVGAGVGFGVLSAFGAFFTDNSIVLGAAAVTAVAFATLAWVAYTRRGAEPACETDFTPAADDDGSRRTREVAGSPRGEPRT